MDDRIPKPYYVDVVLPIPIRNRFTYGINRDEAAFLKQGMRVVVPFGKSKIYTAVVVRVHHQPPQGYEVREIDQILDEQPVITPLQLQHWEWMATYYACTPGETLRTALPNALLLEGQTIVSLNKEATVDTTRLSDDELLLHEALQVQPSLRIDDITSILNRKSVLPVVRALVDKNVAVVQEELTEQYKPKLIRYIRLHKKHAGDHELSELLDALSRAPKQKQTLLTYFSLTSKEKKPVRMKQLEKASGVSAGVIKSLIEKSILEDYFIRTDRLNFDGRKTDGLKELSPPQQKAYEAIKKSFGQRSVTLLHGVTASGKTEIYARLIQDTLQQGKQALYMLPEIALTTQLISRMQAYFGKKVAVYHSGFSQNERVETWYNILQNKPKAQIVVGARSALFLPFADLGLIIIDEEHEPSYKQYNPAPRYHARDSAIMLAHMHGARTLLGSATPAIETYHNAQSGKYGFVRLAKRYLPVKMPEMTMVSLRESQYKKQMKGHFSQTLIEAMQQVFDQGRQIILFQNRRGYSPVVQCQTCGNSPQCPNCDVSLTFYQKENQLRCHYCGYRMALPQTCSACGSTQIDYKGFGTEQIEKELGELFPGKKTARMDYDTTRGRHAYAKIIDAFQQRETDILVGTQMLAKGLDFHNVGLVGVMLADNLLNFPDFRAHERSFQLLLQVAGRAGRLDRRGQVVIQTYNPDHPVLKQVLTRDYETMFTGQLSEREEYRYPPFYRLIKLTLKGRKYERTEAAARWLAEALQNVLGEDIIGPQAPPVGRIRNEYLICIMIKIPQGESPEKVKQVLAMVIKAFSAVRAFRSIKIVPDVDCL